MESILQLVDTYESLADALITLKQAQGTNRHIFLTRVQRAHILKAHRAQRACFLKEDTKGHIFLKVHRAQAWVCFWRTSNTILMSILCENGVKVPVDKDNVIS